LRFDKDMRVQGYRSKLEDLKTVTKFMEKIDSEGKKNIFSILM